MSEMSNRERLEEAGIIGQDLDQGQYEAIESLSEGEVDGLISVKEKLANETSNTNPIIVMPGINPNQGKQGA